MSLEDDVKKDQQKYDGASNPTGAYLNAIDRSAAAAQNNPFFQSGQHTAKVDEVVAIIKATFGNAVDVYQNHRENRGKPFTGVKFSPYRWPSRNVATEQLWKPLEALGYTRSEVKLTKTGYIIRVF